MNNTNNKYFEFLRLAYVAGSQAAESILSEVEFSNEELEVVNGYIKIDGRCRLARFFRDNGQRCESYDGVCFVLDHCFVIKQMNQEHTELRFEYSYYERPERLMVEKALIAIHYVLVQIEPNIEVVINNQ